MSSSDKKQWYAVFGGAAGFVALAILGGIFIPTKADHQAGGDDETEPTPASSWKSAKDLDLDESAKENHSDLELADCTRAEPGESMDGETNMAYPDHAASLDSSGEYLAGTGERGPTVWHGDKKRSIDKTGFLSGDGSFTVNGVNSSGTMIGEASSHRSDRGKAWRFEDGKLIELKPPKGYKFTDKDENRVAAIDINDNGDIVGMATEGGHTVGLKWKAGEQVASRLDTKSGMGSEPHSIHDDGTAVGVRSSTEEDPSETDEKAWMWDPDGKGKELSPGDKTAVSADDIAGDWLHFSEKSGNYRWNMSDKDDPEKIDISNVDTLDADGNGYGSQDKMPVRENGDKIEALPLNDKDPESSADTGPRYTIDNVSDDGKVIVGAINPDEPAAEETDIIMWKCD